ncbi:MAG TPA: protein kinase, partial [Acidimicrobiales bacterium]|nr:protein kinase [Acidimicrobiales bacterium]
METKPDDVVPAEKAAPSERPIERGDGDPPGQPSPRVSLDVGHEIAPGYEIVHSDGSRDPSGRARPIADGGAGVVFRAAYRDLPHRAVKVLAPREDLLDRVGWEKFEESFTREIRTLARVTHTRVAKILDYGRAILPDGGREHLFYAMDFIDGFPFDAALAEYELPPSDVLDLLAQILDGLAHLHSQEIMHCDLKEKNVLLRRGINGIEATIVDLGCAKTLKAPATADSDSGEDDTTTFFSTPKLMMPPWQDRIGQQLTREQLLEMFPLHDLHCFGRLVDIALGGREEQMTAHLGASGFAALVSLKDALVDRPGEVGDARDVEGQWRKLPPGWLAPMSVRELTVGGGGQTSLPTPSGRVGLSSRVKRVLNHQLVQRLRHIPQLELLSTVFPGATHTRLLHSLTTYDTARLYLAHLLGDPAFRLDVEPSDIEATLLWSLLHDVGHYPLSHMFEDFADEEVRRGHDRTIPTDDDLFWCFLDPSSVSGSFRDYPQIIERAAAATGATLGHGLFAFASEDGRFDPEVLEAMRRIEARAEPVHSVLAGVLSSPIDVDKIAYLQDDSLMSGVRFGMGIDLAGLLVSLRMPAAQQV